MQHHRTLRLPAAASSARDSGAVIDIGALSSGGCSGPGHYYDRTVYRCCKAGQPSDCPSFPRSTGSSTTKRNCKPRMLPPFANNALGPDHATVASDAGIAALPAQGGCLGVWTCDRGAGRALPHSPWPALAMQETSGTTLTLTGVLGLAAVVCALYQLRGGPGKLGLRTMRVVSDLRAGAWGACPCSAVAACCRS